MIHIRDHLTKKIEEAAIKAGYNPQPLPAVLVSWSSRKEHGDLMTNVALGWAQHVKKNPREIAQSIVDSIKLDSEQIEKIEVAGPGFINFTLSVQFLCRALEVILDDGEEYGRWDIGQGKRTQVEFVSANPTGPLTIGHGRQAVLGDTIARILEATGHEVIREYYYNDAGRQMEILGMSVRQRYRELLGDSEEFPDEFYQGEYIKEIAQKAVDERGDSLKNSDEVDYFRDLVEKIIFEEIKRTLKRLGVVFDVYTNEKSFYETGKVDGVIQALREKDLAYEKDGALWFRTSCLGLDQDRVIVKSTGEPTYRLPDIAYHKDKMDRGFDLVIDIFGADHVDTYPDVLAALEELVPGSWEKVKVLIHQFVTLMEGKEKIKMSTRKANYVTLDELMDEVGVDVTRYFFLNRSMSSHLNFDLSLAKTQSEENPVYYVQYAHARICSILRHAEREGIDPDSEFDPSLLKAPEELDLIKLLMVYPDIVRQAATLLEPHPIPAYLEEIATAYHRFQHAGKRDDSLRVVTKNIPLTLARLALCRATRVVLTNGFSLLGISRPEKM